WAEDPDAPKPIHKIWASKVDGSLYAGVDFYHTMEDEVRRMAPDPGSVNHSLAIWKRAFGTTPPRARIVEGRLGVSCTRPDPQRAIPSVSVFPVGKTTLTCSAVDVFKNSQPQSIVIDVRDTRPPVISVTPPPPVTTSGTSATVSFTPTASDLAAGNLPLSS